MVRILTRCAIGVLLSGAALIPQTGGTAESDRHRFTAGLELGYVSASGLDSWLEGGVGKLRYDESHDGLIFPRAFLEYKGRATNTLTGTVVLHVDDNRQSKLDATEAYLEFRPVPKSAYRFRGKFGAFYPRLSLENTGSGWSTPFTLSSSAINSWIAEEIRTLGGELSVTRKEPGSSHEFSGLAGLFFGNDPAGSLLAWRGWSLHNYQTGLSGQLPLTPLPVIQPGGILQDQAPFVEPFHEIDDRPGYYAGGEWKYRRRFLARIMHYDNRADPEAYSAGQYAWRTEFDHLGWQLELPWGLGLISQWMRGRSEAGAYLGSTRIVDVEFDAKFALLTKRVGPHRVSARYDDFEVTQNDTTPEDNNPDFGHAWTLAYLYRHSRRLDIAAEWLRIKTHHCGWVYYGLPPEAEETQLQINFRFEFGRDG